MHFHERKERTLFMAGKIKSIAAQYAMITLACALSLQTGATVVTVQLAVFLACAAIGVYRRRRRA